MIYREAETHNFNTRIERIEKQNRRLKITVSIILLFIGAIVVMGQASPKNKIIAAQKFQLIDNDNRGRGGIGVSNDGSAFISLTDNKGKNKIGIQVFPEGNSTIFMRDKNENPIVLLSVVDNSAGLMMNNKNGKAGLNLTGSMVEDVVDCPGLILFDKTGKKRAILGVMESSPVLFLNDKDEKPLAFIGVTKEGKPRITLKDHEGKNTFDAP